MARGIHRKVTFEDRFYRKWCKGKRNHNSSWAKDKRRNSRIFRARDKEELEKEIEEAYED
jgi:hypothetical protein